jgi:hypothetical protein
VSAQKIGQRNETKRGISEGTGRRRYEAGSEERTGRKAAADNRGR